MKPRKLTFWPLVAATFLIVSGGAYGTEDIIGGAGYRGAIWILLLTPLFWSLPVAFMVGELSTALPVDGGYYVWVRRAMGDFWGFQEAWLSLVASIFDMAIYPALFVAYLQHLLPWFGAGHRGLVVGVLIVAVAMIMNIAGIHTVGISSLWIFALLSAPFAALVLLAPFKAGALSHLSVAHAAPSVGLLGGILVAMWNYMGWDNASTVAGEVERPRRAYPRAIFLTLGIVALTYLLPVAAVWLTGAPASTFETGSWAEVAGWLGGPWLRLALVAGGMFSAFGMLNALVMSYSRLPLAMAQDGMLPRTFGKLHPRTGAPWVAIVACAVGWSVCLGLGFENLIVLDVVLSGASVLLEFAALIVLRRKEPGLERPFRVPGGIWGVALIGVGPALLVALSSAQSATEHIWRINGLLAGGLLAFAGFLLYAVVRALAANGRLAAALKARKAA
ncbi:MAG TPA: APC family permease [Candidatus Acidoferrales bacterium]|nr:APC family permease [Candidatus Acidoferrales bacterium]